MRRLGKQPPKRLVYALISAERIMLRRVATGEVVDDVPQAAIDLQGAAVAYGRAAGDAAQWRDDLRLVNGFSHPRCVLGDMHVATLTLAHFLELLLNPRGKRRWRKMKPEVVIHVAGVRDLSGLEAWGLQRVGEQAGAAAVRIWLGEETPYESLIGGAPQGGSWLSLAPAKKR